MTSISNYFATVGKGYVTVDASFNSRMRLFANVQRNASGWTIITIFKPSTGLYRVSSVEYDGQIVDTYGIRIEHNMRLESDSSRIIISGRCNVDSKWDFDDFLESVSNKLAVEWEFDTSSACHGSGLTFYELSQLRHGKCNDIITVKKQFTFSEIAGRCVRKTAYTTYGVILPFDGDEDFNDDLLGRDDYDPTLLLPSGTYGCVWWELQTVLSYND